LAFSLLVPGQGLTLAGRAAVNPTVLGAPVSFILEVTSTVGLSSGCGINEIRAGSPTGPVVYQPFICPAIIITITPGAPYTYNWDQRNNSGLQVPAGTYYARFSYWDQNFANIVHRWVPVRIDDPAAPPLATLSATGFPTTGSLFSIQILDTNNPGAFYVIAASFTTDTGWTVAPGTHIALDQDALWNLSYPIPSPQLFLGFNGALDATGLTLVPSIAVPPLPQLIGLPLAIQGAVLGSGGTVLTNPLSTVIR
jgi:hypothetical protein